MKNSPLPGHTKFRHKRAKKMLPAHSALRLLFERRGGAGVFARLDLWRQWEEVMGPDIASLGLPLGSRNSVLQVVAHDSMAMQDLKMQSDIILEKANTLMGDTPFTSVTFSLPDARTPLTALPQRPTPTKTNERPAPPENFGNIAHLMDPDTTVGRCYHAVRALYFQK